ncbi:MAG: sugar ABC transporter substrate-binding protein [Blastocatellia bacterium]|nr:sugar ABC transporter substrate-binding protein [Blastocatellia bacterium]
MDKKTIAVSLPHDETNQYQRLILDDARRAAQKAGFEVDSYFCKGQVTTQIRHIYECIHGEASRRTCAIIAMPVTDNSLNRVAADALRAGLGWICLHREMDCLDDLRREFPSLPVSAVGPDQREIGRIQGRQFRALLPRGGRLLYVQGNATTSSARNRLEGMKEQIAGSGIEASVLDGNWNTEDAERTVTGWLRMVMSGSSSLDLAGCQNDEMAVGARTALDSVAAYLKRRDLESVMVTGCNGLVDFGQRLVNEGKMVATIIVPSTGAAAVELIAAARERKPVPPSRMLPSISYPDEATLAARARKNH